MQLGADEWPAVGIGIVRFLAAMVVNAWYTRRVLGTLMRQHRPLFPRPTAAAD